MATESPVVELGTAAPEFALPTTTGEVIALADFADRPALLVAFICNHCPYVRHVEAGLAKVVADYADQGLGAVGICPNDAAAYPEDAPEHLAAQAVRAGFSFPYLVDETQDVARAYGAVCTPDLYLYDRDRRLAYRGQLDGARPATDEPVTGESLRAAIDHVLGGRQVPGPHRPSVGCSIKWRP